MMKNNNLVMMTLTTMVRLMMMMMRLVSIKTMVPKLWKGTQAVEIMM
jgi:hypothetical protein